jgi:hypothetical protein
MRKPIQYYIAKIILMGKNEYAPLNSIQMYLLRKLAGTLPKGHSGRIFLEKPFTKDITR